MNVLFDLKPVYWVTTGVLLLFFSGCMQEDPFVSESRVEDFYSPGNVQDIAVIYNNDVYLIPHYDKDPRRLTETPDQTKKDIRISPDGQKLAYLSGSGSPVILDREGNIIDSVTEYDNIKCMDWSFNNKTLYMLSNDSVRYYGPSLDLPSFRYPDHHDKILSDTVPVNISVSANGALAYIARYTESKTLYVDEEHYEVHVIKKGEKNAVKFPYGDDMELKRVNFSGHNNDLVITGIPDDVLYDIEHRFRNNMDGGYGGGYDRDGGDVTYRSDLGVKVLKSKGNEEKRFPDQVVSIKMMDHEKNYKDKFFPRFNNADNPLFVDWK